MRLKKDAARIIQNFGTSGNVVNILEIHWPFLVTYHVTQEEQLGAFVQRAITIGLLRGD